MLEPYADDIERRFTAWLEAQQAAGRSFTPEQVEWLVMIKDHIVTSLTVDVDDLELAPFASKGGPFKAAQVFGGQLDDILREINEALAA